jgi:hypothetical protein
MSELNPNQVHQLWLQAAEKVKDRVIAPTLYRALELPRGIMIDGDEFILGFSNQDLPMAGHLRSAQHKAIIEQCISDVVKKKVRLRIIEGTTIADYEHFKNQQAAKTVAATTMSVQREQERAVLAAWDEVSEKITRAYAHLHLRQLAQNRAMFMMEAFKVINEAVNRMGYDSNTDEISQRALARVFEKFATAVDIPSTMLAYEFIKLRKEGKLS